jgi:hypothetical protein
MMLAELAICIHEERNRKWNSERNVMAQRRAAAVLDRVGRRQSLRASFARYGRELARAMRRGHASRVSPQGGAR